MGAMDPTKIETQAYSFRPGSTSSISLRPGGGRPAPNSSSRLDSSNVFNFQHQVNNLEPERLTSKSSKRYTIQELLSYRQSCLEIPQDLLDSNLEILSAYSPSSDSNWSQKDSKSHAKPVESDDRDWRVRSENSTQGYQRPATSSRRPGDGERSSSESQSRETNGNFQSSSGEAPQIVKAANPWQPRRSNGDDKDKVLRAVKGILNKLTPEKFEVLIEQLINVGINSAPILQAVISLVFDKAVLEPTFCATYAEMCFRLSKALPEFPPEPSEDPTNMKPISFRRVLLNTCQEEFEGSTNLRNELKNSTEPEKRQELERKLKMRTLGNIRLIGELFKQRMIPEKIVHACIQNLLNESKSEYAEDNIEALCSLMATVGKGMDESPKSKFALDSYMKQINELGNSSHLSSRLRFMCKDLIELQKNKWVPRREEVKAKKLDQIHAEAEAKLGLRPGSASSMRGIVSSSSRELLFPPNPNSASSRLPNVGSPLVMAPNVELEGWETVSMNRRSKKDLSVPTPIFTRSQSAMPSVGMRKASIGGLQQSSTLTQTSSLVGKPSALLSSPVVVGGDVKSSVRDVPQQSTNMNQAGPKYLSGAIGDLPSRQTEALQKTEPSVSDEERWNTKIQSKTESLLSEYFSVADLNEALICVQELKLGGLELQFFNLCMRVAFEKKERERMLFSKLVPFLFSNKALSKDAINAGFLKFAQHLEDLTLDVPPAPLDFGLILGRCIYSGCSDASFISNILNAIEDYALRRRLFLATLKSIQEVGGGNSSNILLIQKGLRSLLKEDDEAPDVLFPIEKFIGAPLSE